MNKKALLLLPSTANDVLYYCSNCHTIYTEDIKRCPYCKEWLIKISKYQWREYDHSF